MTRQYAKYMGIAIVAIGVVGLLMGEQPILGFLNIDIAEDLVHLASGGAMAFVAFTHRDNHVLRMIVGVIGVTYLAVGVIGFLIPHVFGLLPHGYSTFDNVLHLVLGVMGILVAWGREATEGPNLSSRP
ncbi:MAG: hypothetical protein H0V35_03770 [Nitrospira sp.]|nr:hypothetical protein [Nitrospira sp.]